MNKVERYNHLKIQLRHLHLQDQTATAEEDNILDEMDVIWFDMTEEEKKEVG